MTTVYSDSPYGLTIYVGPNQPTLSNDTLQLCASFTQGGTIPFTIRYLYSWKYIEATQTTPPTYQWGPLDEAVDKVNAIPGLQMMLPLSYAPTWWCNLKGNGQNVGYGYGVLPDGPAMATFAAAVSARYGDRIAFYQIGNEEWDTLSHDGGMLAKLFNYAAPVIRANTSNALVGPCSVRNQKSEGGGQHIQNFLTQFFTYVPGSGEPVQAIPDFFDAHIYRDGSTLDANGLNPSPDPTTTDNSQNSLNANYQSLEDQVAMMQSLCTQYSSNTSVWICENGYNIPNNSPDNHNAAPSELAIQQSRVQRAVMARGQYYNIGRYCWYSAASYVDPKASATQTITDITAHILANPQWTTGTTPPQPLLYLSNDTFWFEGYATTAPLTQYFSIMNPTTSSVSWSLGTPSASWLTCSTIPINGWSNHSGENLTSGTLAAGHSITLKILGDSTTSGLTQQSLLTGTISLTIGASYTGTITATLFVLPSGSVPQVNTPTTLHPTMAMTMNVQGTPPTSQSFSFTNNDPVAKASWWAFTGGDWLTIDTISGILAQGASQTITVGVVSSVVQKLSPGTYEECVVVSVMPNPTPYAYPKSSPTPTQTEQFMQLYVTLTIKKAKSPAIALFVSTPTLYYTGITGASPPAQLFYIENCSDTAYNWTATVGSYSSGGTGWLTLSPASGTGLPAWGSQSGSGNQVQDTNYALITATPSATGLSAGTYTATITVTLSTGTTQTIAVTYVVTSAGVTKIVTISSTTEVLTVASGGSAQTASVIVSNIGNAGGNWSHTNNYSSNGSGWCKLAPGNGNLGAGGSVNAVITATPGTLAPDTYTCTLNLTMSTSTAQCVVTFVVTAVGGQFSLLTLTRPQGSTFINNTSSLNFVSTLGSPNPSLQTLYLTNIGSGSGNWYTTVTYVNSSNPPWLSVRPTNGSILSGQRVSLSVLVDTSQLLVAGTYLGTVSCTDNSSNTTSSLITFGVLPSYPSDQVLATLPPIRFAIGTYQPLNNTQNARVGSGFPIQPAQLLNPYAGLYGGTYGFLLDTRIKQPQQTTYIPASEIGLDTSGLSVVRGYPQITWSYTSMTPDYWYYLQFLYQQSCRTPAGFQYLVLIQYPNPDGTRTAVQALARMDPPTFSNRDVGTFYGVTLHFTYVGQAVLAAGTLIQVLS